MSLPCWTDKQDSVRPLTLFDCFPCLSWTVDPGLLLLQILSCSPCSWPQSASPELDVEGTNPVDLFESGEGGVAHADEEGVGCRPVQPVSPSESR